jgi:hypothetical protein
MPIVDKDESTALPVLLTLFVISKHCGNSDEVRAYHIRW